MCKLRAQARAIERARAPGWEEAADRAWGKYKRACVSKKWEWRKQAFADVERICAENRPRLWELVDRVLGETRSTAMPVPARALAEYYRRVFCVAGMPERLPGPDVCVHAPADSAECPFSVEDVRRALAHVKPGKAPGIDEMPAHVLGRLRWHKGTAEMLYAMIRLLVHYAYWPGLWNELLVVPALKRGKPPDDPASYRPIHLIPVLAKLVASLIDAKLQEWVPRAPEQFGFSWGHGTRDCVITAARVFEQYGRRPGGLHTAFVDFKGAFDSVDRVRLMSKLDGMAREGRVPAEVVRMIASMYTNVHATVKTQNALGSTASLRFPETIGVKQGDPLGPRLFNLFIHDLPTALHRLAASTMPVSINGHIVRCLLYADDLALFSTTREGLQAQLDALAAYCDMWGLTVSVPKTEYMQVYTGPASSAPSAQRVTYKGVPIKWTASFRYLGVVFSNDGSFVPFFTMNVEKARRAMFACLARVARLTDRCPLAHRITLLRAYVVSIAMYGCDALPVPAWYVRKIDSILYTFLRWTLHLPGMPSKLVLFRECGVVGMAALVLRAQASYLATNRFFRAPPHHVLDAIHSIASEPRSRLHSQWYVPAARYLEEAGLGGSSLPQSILALKPRLHKAAVTEWLKRVGDREWIRSCTLPTEAPIRSNVFTVDSGAPQPALVEPVLGRQLCLAEPSHAAAALQRALLGDAHTLWHVDLATVAARRVAGYAQAALPPHQLRAIAMFRMACTPLALHTKHDVPVVSRTCQFCCYHRGVHIVEDDFHAVFECPLYDTFRVAFFRPLPALSACSRPNTSQEALRHALSTIDAHHSRALGRFLSRVLYTREIYLARLSLSPVASRPDNLACTQAASVARIDDELRASSELCVAAWWRRPLPIPYVLVLPESGIVKF